jgi:hypothetical protein
MIAKEVKLQSTGLGSCVIRAIFGWSGSEKRWIQKSMHSLASVDLESVTCGSRNMHLLLTVFDCFIRATDGHRRETLQPTLAG